MLRFLNLVALLGSVAWLSKSPDWEPLVTSIGLFGALLAQEYPLLKGNRERDRALFLLFKQQFPSNGKTARFLKDHDIGGAFSTDALNDLDRFLGEWTNAEHEFIDGKLETARKALLIVGRQFNRKLSNAVSMDHNGRYSIGLHDMEMRPEMLLLQKELNDEATRVFRAHQGLMRAGSRIE